MGLNAPTKVWKLDMDRIRFDESLAARGESRAGPAPPACGLGSGPSLSNLAVFPRILRRFDASIPIPIRGARPRGTFTMGCQVDPPIVSMVSANAGLNIQTNGKLQ